MFRQLLAICFLLFAVQAFGQDRVKLNQINEVYGEIKSLKYGTLTFDTDDAGLLTIDWINVVQLESKDLYDITLRDKRRYEGSLESSGVDGEIAVVSGSDRVELKMNQVVAITELESSFISRIDGFVNGGLQYTKASEVLTFNLGAEVNYRSFTDEISLAGNAVLTTQKINEDSTEVNRKNNVSINYRRFFKKRWFVNALGGWEQNTELGVDSRIYVGGQAGKTLFETNVNMMRVSVGSIYTNETSIEGVTIDNAEGIVELYYKVFKKTMPKISLTTSLFTYPSFTSAGRVRLDGQVDLSTELIDDFTFGISNYHNYDNEPISASASNYDWGINVNLGYSF